MRSVYQNAGKSFRCTTCRHHFPIKRTCHWCRRAFCGGDFGRHEIAPCPVGVRRIAERRALAAGVKVEGIDDKA